MKKYNIFRNIKKYGLKSVFTKNLIVFVAILTLSFSAIGIVAYYMSYNKINSAVDMMATQKTSDVSYAYDSVMRSMAKLLYNNNDIYKIFTMLSNDEITDDESEEAMKRLNTYTNTHEYVKSISVYNEKTDELMSGTYFLYGSFKKDFIFEHYRDSSISELAIFSDENDLKGRLVFMRKIVSASNAPAGYIAISIDIPAMYESLGFSANRSNPGSDIVLYLDKDKNIVTSGERSMVGHKFSEIMKTSGKGRAEYKNTSYKYDSNDAYLGGQYIYLYNMSFYGIVNTNLIQFLILILIYVLIVSIVISAYISKRSITPLMEIIDSMQNIGNIPDKYTDEISFITGSIFRLEEEKVVLDTEMREKLRLLTKFQLAALQNQMNPHFLSNTFETLKWMVIDIEDGDSEVSDAIEKLSEISKYSLNNAEYIVPIKTEIEYTKTYVDIIKLRFEDKINIEWIIEESITDCETLKFSLQPILENAVNHAMSKDIAVLNIKIDIADRGDNVVITIADNGCGIAADKLKKITSMLEEDYTKPSAGIGLINTNTRIKLIFGKNYGISVDSDGHRGTTVAIRLPKIRETERDEKKSEKSD